MPLVIVVVECGVASSPSKDVPCAGCGHPAHRHLFTAPHRCCGAGQPIGACPTCMCEAFVVPEGCEVVGEI